MPTDRHPLLDLALTVDVPLTPEQLSEGCDLTPIKDFFYGWKGCI